MSADRRLSFGYWSDPLCIWAYVAQDKLERLMAERGALLLSDYHLITIFGSVPWRFAHGPWAREGVEGRVRATRAIAQRSGHTEVDGECWAQDLPASSWSPGAAIKAVCALEREGRIASGLGGEYQKRLRQRFFVEKQNIARRAVQLSLAEELGIGRAEVERGLDDGTAYAALWEDAQEKERLKLQGSPTYVFDQGRAMLYGNFAYGVLHATVDELLRGLGPDGSAC